MSYQPLRHKTKFFHQPIFCQTCNPLARWSVTPTISTWTNQQRLSKICENAHISYVHSRVILLCKSEIRTKDCSVGGMYWQFLFSNYIMSPSKRKGKNMPLFHRYSRLLSILKLVPLIECARIVIFSFYLLFAMSS